MNRPPRSHPLYSIIPIAFYPLNNRPTARNSEQNRNKNICLHCIANVLESREVQVPKRGTVASQAISRYRILERLGEGGMGEANPAED